MGGNDIPAEAASLEPTIVDETSPPENDSEGAAVVDGKSKNKKGKKFDKKEQVPIEELYDLSKPIKRVSADVLMSILILSPPHIHLIS